MIIYKIILTHPMKAYKDKVCCFPQKFSPSHPKKCIQIKQNYSDYSKTAEQSSNREQDKILTIVPIKTTKKNSHKIIHKSSEMNSIEMKNKYEKFIIEESFEAPIQNISMHQDHRDQQTITDQNQKPQDQFVPLKNAVINEASNSKSFQRKLLKERLRTLATGQASQESPNRHHYIDLKKKHQKCTLHAEDSSVIKKCKKRLKSYQQFIEQTNNQHLDDIQLLTYRNLMKIRKKMTLQNHQILNLSYDGKRQPIHSPSKNQQKLIVKNQKPFKSTSKADRYHKQKLNSTFYSIDSFTRPKNKNVIHIVDNHKDSISDSRKAVPYKKSSFNSRKIDKSSTRIMNFSFNKNNSSDNTKEGLNENSSRNQHERETLFTPWTKRSRYEIAAHVDSQFIQCTQS